MSMAARYDRRWDDVRLQRSRCAHRAREWGEAQRARPPARGCDGRQWRGVSRASEWGVGLGGRRSFELCKPLRIIHIHACLNRPSVCQNFCLWAIASLCPDPVMTPRQINQDIYPWFFVGLVNDGVWIAPQCYWEGLPPIQWVPWTNLLMKCINEDVHRVEVRHRPRGAKMKRGIRHARRPAFNHLPKTNVSRLPSVRLRKNARKNTGIGDCTNIPSRIRCERCSNPLIENKMGVVRPVGSGRRIGSVST